MVPRPQTRILKQIAIFAGLRVETLDFLLGRSSLVTVPPGGFFFREGEIGHALYVLERGAVQVLKEHDGVEIQLRTFGVGDCVGEIALLAVMPRSASVRAVEECVAIRLTNADLLALYEHDVEQFAMMVLNMAREVSRRLWVANEMLFGYVGFLGLPPDPAAQTEAPP